MKELISMKKIDIKGIIKDQVNLSLSDSYHHYDFVEQIDIEIIHHQYHIHSCMRILAQEIHCDLIMDDQYQIIDNHCECPWHSYCAHIGATLLKINQLNINAFPFHYESIIKQKRDKEKYLDEMNKKTKLSKNIIKQYKENYQKHIRHALQQEKYEMKPFLPQHDNKCFPFQDDMTFDDFYQAYENRQYDFLRLEESCQKIPLMIISKQDVYILRLAQEKHMFFGRFHVYSLKSHRDMLFIERFKLDDEGLAIHLIRTLYEHPITILKQDYQDFYKYVFMPLLDYFDIQSPIEINHSYDLIKIYGDIDDDFQIYLKVYYVDENQNRILGFNRDYITHYEQDIVENYIRQYASFIDEDQHVVYFDRYSEKTYMFIKEGLDFLQDYAEIYVSDAFKKMKKVKNVSITIGVKIDNDLLSIDIKSPNISHEDISQILQQYQLKKKYYRLKNGEVLSLDLPQFKELQNFMNNYHIEPEDLHNGQTKISINHMFSIDQDGENFQYIQIERHHSFLNILNDFHIKSKASFDIPSHYESILKDYQKDGYRWMRLLNHYGFNGILADDMGLGKTLQVISLLEGLHTFAPSIVVCPSSLIFNWEDEVHKFSHNLHVICVTGKRQEREMKIAHVGNRDLLVTSYDYMRRDYQMYENIQFDYVILDEAQYIKNPKTQNAMSVKKLKAFHKLALTGTPIENSLTELWSIFDFLMPQYLYSYSYFQTHFENAIIKRHDQKKSLELQRLISPFLLRRNKKDVLLQLPEKNEKTIYIPFTEKENQLYLAHLAKINKDLKVLLQREKIDHISILAMLTRLRQICCEPRLIFENIDNISSKMKVCKELINNLKDNHQRVLLFSSFTSILELLGEELQSEGITYYQLTGKTSQQKRKEMVQGFQKGNVDVFLISLRAGGTGLNLTGAQTVIHFDPWWNMSAQNQATDRAYRIGQQKNVQVLKLVMKDSIEEKILALQDKKKELADLFVENNTENMTQMSEEEILSLIS